jgi:hypothetical protein
MKWHRHIVQNFHTTYIILPFYYFIIPLFKRLPTDYHRNRMRDMQDKKYFAVMS